MSKLLLGFIRLTSTCLQGYAKALSSPEFSFDSGIAIYQGNLFPYRYGSMRKVDLRFNFFSNFQLHPVF